MKKKKWPWIVGVILILGIIGNLVGNGELETQSTENTEKKVVEKEVDLSKDELNEQNIKKIVDNITNADETTITIDGNEVNIMYYKKNLLSEKSTVEENAKDAVKIAEQIYKNQNVNELWISQEADVMDEKGAESREQIIGQSFSKETVKGVNWENMYTLVVEDYMKLQSITLSYSIIPAFQK